MRTLVARSLVEPPRVDADKVIYAAAANVTLTADATAHTKGAWAEVIASTSDAVGLLQVYVGGIGVNGVNTSSLIDIGIGGAGSEVVIAANIAVGGAGWFAFAVPMSLPAGTRVAMRMQSLVTGGKTAAVRVLAYRPPRWAAVGRSNVDVLGTSSAASTGTAMSASANTFVDVVAATARAYAGVVLVPSLSTASTSGAELMMTMAVGAAGAEVEFLALPISRGSTENISLFGASLPVMRHIPAGSRLAAKISAASSACCATVIGIPY